MIYNIFSDAVTETTLLINEKYTNVTQVAKGTITFLFDLQQIGIHIV